MEYTKGEWEVELFNKDRGERGGYFIGNGEIAIATMVSVPEVKANARLIASAPILYEELVEADKVICELCKRLNPQHATADYGKGCDWCGDREDRLKVLAKAEGK